MNSDWNHAAFLRVPNAPLAGTQRHESLMSSNDASTTNPAVNNILTASIVLKNAMCLPPSSKNRYGTISVYPRVLCLA